MTTVAPGHLHVTLAERGKACALRGEHVQALLHYREAMRLAVQAKMPEVVFRHYLECSLESLEHMGAFDEVLAYCDRAIDHYRRHPPAHQLAQLDLASIHQRRGVVLTKQGARAEATSALTRACDQARAIPASLPLAEMLLRWLQAGLTVTTERLAAELRRSRYFSVRFGTMQEVRAAPVTPVALGSMGFSPSSKGG